jgi:hypothetical protein
MESAGAAFGGTHTCVMLRCGLTDTLPDRPTRGLQHSAITAQRIRHAMPTTAARTRIPFPPARLLPKPSSRTIAPRTSPPPPGCSEAPPPTPPASAAGTSFPPPSSTAQASPAPCRL